MTVCLTWKSSLSKITISASLPFSSDPRRSYTPKVFGRVHRRQGNRIRQGRPCIDHKMQERFIHCRNAAGQGTIGQAGFAVLNEHLLAA